MYIHLRKNGKTWPNNRPQYSKIRKIEMTKKENVSRKLLAKLDGTCGGNFDKTSRASQACEWLFLSSEKIKSRLQKNWRQPKIRDFTEAWHSPQVPCYKLSLAKKMTTSPFNFFNSRYKKMKKIVAEKLSRDRRKIFDQRRNQQPQEFLFLSFASIVTCPHVTDFWV